MNNKKIGAKDYPLYLKRPDLIKSLTGKTLDQINLDAILTDHISEKDLRISPDVLLLQAEIAESESKAALAQNFRRAAELCVVPDQKVLAIYEALRPYRETRQGLEAIADELEQKYEAVLNAQLIREAVKAYAERNLLKDS